MRDCAIVSAVIKVEHFEMGSYRSLVTGAQLMGQSDAAQLLKQNMDQEEQTAKLAESTSGQLLSNAMKEEGQEPEEGLLQKAKDMLGASSHTLGSRTKAQGSTEPWAFLSASYAS